MQRTRRTGKSWLMRFTVGLTVTLGLSLLLVMATLMFGHVSGEEFSPELFRRRTYSYWEIPLLQWQITPIQRDDSTGSLERYLKRNGIVSEQKKKEINWDLVFGRRSGLTIAEGDAQILCTYLDAAESDGELMWLAWSKEHPTLAKLLWPVVVSLAREELYMFVPEVVELARGHQQPAELENAVNHSLAEQFFYLANSQQQLQQHEKAVQHFTTALKYDASHIGSLRGRAKSHEALGDAKKATADRSAAAKLSGKNVEAELSE